jgi:hypothetical protein
VNTVDELRDTLDYPFDAPAPDTAAIIASGRRRRATRRALAGSGLACVAAGVAVAVLAGGAPPRHAVEPEQAGGAPNPALVAATSALTSTAPDSFDPLTRTLHVGWVPAGLKNETAEITPWSQTYGGFDASSVNGGPDVGLVVEILARGRPVSDFSNGALGLPMDAVSHPTDPINGQPAECLSAPVVPEETDIPQSRRSLAAAAKASRPPAQACPAIRWHYAPGAWARVSYAGSAGTTPEAADAVTRRVAESVSLTAGEPVRLPFTLSGASAAMKAAATSVTIYHAGTTGDQGERWSASINLVAGTGDLSIEVVRPNDPSGHIEGDKAAPNTTVDGHPAWRQSDGGALVVWGISGTRVGVGFEDRPGNAAAAFADMHLLTALDDPAQWVAVH